MVYNIITNMSHNELETYMLSRHGLEQPLLKYLLKHYETH